MDDETLQWAAHAVYADARVLDATQLRADSGPWLLRIEHDSDVLDTVLKSGPSVDWKSEYATEAAALRLGADHGLAVPRVLATELERDRVALLLVHIPGSTAVPAAPSAERLRAAGRAAARVHAIELQPSSDLPTRERHMPWVDYALWRRLANRYAQGDQRRALRDLGWPDEAGRKLLGGIESSALLQEADNRIRDYVMTPFDPVFVHGDLWQGNLVWDGDDVVGIIDWESAGAGHYGVDLGCLRWDAAVLFGGSAPDEVLAGWEAERGHPAEHLAYWDVVASLNAPANMGEFLPSFTEAGRSDLDEQTLNGRRDDFLRSALGRLDATVSA